MPSFCVANSQQAVNHTVSGVRVRSKIVPAVTEVRGAAAGALEPTVAQPPATGVTAAGQTNPSGQRSHSR